jgi:hypothetical protein
VPDVSETVLDKLKVDSHWLTLRFGIRSARIMTCSTIFAHMMAPTSRRG